MIELNRYDDYLKANDHLIFDEFNQIYHRLSVTSTLNDAYFQELWREMIVSAFVYAKRRAEWSVQSSAERREVDEIRTYEHNDFMTNLKVIYRYLKTEGKAIDWFEQLGTPEKDRKRFGDFACYLTLIHSLNAR